MEFCRHIGERLSSNVIEPLVGRGRVEPSRFRIVTANLEIIKERQEFLKRFHALTAAVQTRFEAMRFGNA